MKTLRGKSPIHGFGLFADEKIPANTLIINTGHESKFVSEKDHDPSSRTDVRLIGDIFITGEIEDCDFLNHSDQPNAIFLLGFLFSTKEIRKGDEIFCDYRLINSKGSRDVVEGFSARRSLSVQINWALLNIERLRI